MKEAKKPLLANRCFGGNCPPKKPEDKIKDVLLDAAKRRRANKEIDNLLRQFKGKKAIVELLPAIKRRCSRNALRVAIERVERRRDGLSLENLMFFEEFKALLEKEEQS